MKRKLLGIGSITYKYAGQGGLNKAFLGYGVLPFKNAELNYRKALRTINRNRASCLIFKRKASFNKISS